MIDTGALKKSIAGYRQYLTYRKIHNTAVNILKAGTINVQFGIGSTPSIGSVIVNTLVSNVEFYIIKANIPFLLYLIDIDILKVYYNNFKNLLITQMKSVPVIYQFTYPFLL